VGDQLGVAGIIDRSGVQHIRLRHAPLDIPRLDTLLAALHSGAKTSPVKRQHMT
jgi:hypothetical protein